MSAYTVSLDGSQAGNQCLDPKPNEEIPLYLCCMGHSLSVAPLYSHMVLVSMYNIS
jgi:hypothetical protein